MAGLGGGGKSPGPRGSPSTSPTKSWSSIASMNVSKRNKTNTLEVRLENDEGYGCSLKDEEIERLLRRLNIQVSQFTSVQACPERRNVVYITLTTGIDITKFITNSNESFILKQGIRTTSIKPVNKREVNVQVFGLHPDTKDEAVIRYLNAHGKVNTKQPITYGVFPGAPGSSLLAGKRNGNRIYSMEVKKNIGSAHIIDGEKVSIRYPGQTKTCNKCHQPSNTCPGKGMAKDCSSEKILLSQHMISYWNQINFKPETTDMNEVDIETDEEIAKTVHEVKNKPNKVQTTTALSNRYNGVVVKGFMKDSKLEEIVETLKEAGLPFDYDTDDFHINERFEKLTIYIHDLKPETCIELINNLHGHEKLNRKLSIYSLVEDTPTKDLGNELANLINSSTTPATDALNTSATASVPSVSLDYFNEFESLTDPTLTKSGRFWADQIDDLHLSDDGSEENVNLMREAFKRKATNSPDSNEFGIVLSKKEKKKLKQLLNKSN
jgi:hypothetical protein